MSEAALTQHTKRIVNVATAEGAPLSDAIAATARALAMLILVKSQRDGESFDELLKTTLTSVARFAMDRIQA